MSAELDQLVAAVGASPKYRQVSPDVIRRIGARELAVRPTLKAAIKETKNALHQAAGAFMERPIDYDRALETLTAAWEAGGGDLAAPGFREACRQVMGLHTSTRERLPILDVFFAETLAGLEGVRTVLDVACGLNPLARPWMPFGPDVVYSACDIYLDQAAFVDAFLRLIGLPGQATTCDVIGRVPSEAVDLALVLKTLPCLETADRAAPMRLLAGLNARWLLVSFPAQSLGGRRKGQAAHYEARFLEGTAASGWAVSRFTFETELAFLIDKGTFPTSGEQADGR
jgi:16S rRNA (guanine(1405)-N(7))-methyltransferase